MRKITLFFSILLVVELLAGCSCSAQSPEPATKLDYEKGFVCDSAALFYEGGTTVIRHLSQTPDLLTTTTPLGWIAYRVHHPAPTTEGQELQKLPLVVFLHGAGERGTDNEAQMRLCVPYLLSDAVQSHEPFRLLIPQCPEGVRWVETDWTLLKHDMPQEPSPQLLIVMKLIDEMVANGEVDPSRIYIMGISMGGFGTWDALQRWPERFAAAIPICGGGDPHYVFRLAEKPIRIFHGKKDKLVKVCRSQDMYDAIINSGGKNTSLTLYDNLGHFCWDQALQTPHLFEWLFSQTTNNE